MIFAKSEGQNMNVTVKRGQVSCTQARQVLTSFFSGHGVQHGGPSESSLYWTLPAAGDVSSRQVGAVAVVVAAIRRRI